MSLDIAITDNSAEVLAELERHLENGLEEIGRRATNYTAVLTPVGTPESTGVEGYHGGTLRNSMTHREDVKERSVIIGTNISYAPYVELGTGVYAADGNGRKSPWIWTDKNGKKHWTRGMEPQHMIKRGIEEHIDEYKKVMEDELKS